MQHRPKVRVDTLEGFRQLLEATPEHAPAPEEITKSEAVRQLLPEIRAMQSKGYRLPSIAAMLSEHGLPVSVWTLRNICKGVPLEEAQRAPRSRARSRSNGTPKDTSRAPSADSRAYLGRTQGETRRDPAVAAESRPEGGSEPRSEGRSTEAPTNALKAVSSTGAGGVPDAKPSAPSDASHEGPSQAVPERRSAFVPRPDTEEI